MANHICLDRKFCVLAAALGAVVLYYWGFWSYEAGLRHGWEQCERESGN